MGCLICGETQCLICAYMPVQCDVWLNHKCEYVLKHNMMCPESCCLFADILLRDATVHLLQVELIAEHPLAVLAHPGLPTLP